MLDNYDPIEGAPTLVGTPIEVVGGVFEFATLEVETGGVLRFEGSRPARLFVRGLARVTGAIDVSGASPGAHLSMPCDPAVEDPLDPLFCSGPPCDPGVVDPADPQFCDAERLELLAAYAAGFRGGPGATGSGGGASGGAGADLPTTSDPGLLAIGGLESPPSQAPVLPTLNGAPGGGVVLPSALAPTSATGGGAGGDLYPAVLPTAVLPAGFGGLAFNSGCIWNNPASPGGGGSYATVGTAGEPRPYTNGAPSGVPASGALAGEAPTLDAPARTLDPLQGFLRGGAGGGGGGAHVASTRGVVPVMPRRKPPG